MPNWKQAQPAPLELKKLLQYTFPEIKEKIPDGNGGMKWNYDIYAPRKIEGSTKDSDHAEGRAIDIYLDAYNISERMIGDYLFKVFIDNAEDMGIVYVIWNFDIWEKSTGKKRDYEKNNKHTNHIHVSWSQGGSQKIIFGSVPARLMLRVGFPSRLPDPILKDASRFA
jgi:hypothetical protein